MVDTGVDFNEFVDFFICPPADIPDMLIIFCFCGYQHQGFILRPDEVQIDYEKRSFHFHFSQLKLEIHTDPLVFLNIETKRGMAILIDKIPKPGDQTLRALGMWTSINGYLTPTCPPTCKYHGK